MESDVSIHQYVCDCRNNALKQEFPAEAVWDMFCPHFYLLFYLEHIDAHTEKELPTLGQVQLDEESSWRVPGLV